MNIVLLDAPTRDIHGSVYGSHFTPELVATAGKVAAAGVLSQCQIMTAHDLKIGDFRKIEQQLLKMKLSDILFSFPTGPRYDVFGYRWATCR